MSNLTRDGCIISEDAKLVDTSTASDNVRRCEFDLHNCLVLYTSTCQLRYCKLCNKYDQINRRGRRQARPESTGSLGRFGEEGNGILPGDGLMQRKLFV
jgi:hypothetical protein